MTKSDGKRPRVAIIGAGKVGSAIAILLHRKGYVIAAVASRSKAHAEALASRVGSRVAEGPSECAASGDVIFITTPDREVARVTEEIARRGGFRQGQVVAHTSGYLSSQELSAAREAGASVASMHPLQSFADVDMAISALPGSLMAIEGDEEALPVVKSIALELGTRPFVIQAGSKPLYHAAAAIASNYLVSLIHLSIELLGKLGLSEREALEGLGPLIEGTLRNVLELGPVRALTGPIARGDAGVVRGHIKALSGVGEEELRLYSLLGLHTVRIAAEKGRLTGVDLPQLSVIKDLLEEGFCDE